MNPMPSAFPAVTAAIAASYVPQVFGSLDLAATLGLLHWYGGLVQALVPFFLVRSSQRQITQRLSLVIRSSALGSLRDVSDVGVRLLGHSVRPALQRLRAGAWLVSQSARGKGFCQPYR